MLPGRCTGHTINLLRHGVLAALVAGVALGVAAQQPAATDKPEPAPAFVLTIHAPETVAAYLQRHLALVRYGGLTDLDDNELRRLLVAAEHDARELLATLGHFSPEVALTWQPASAGSARQVTLTVQPGVAARIAAVDLRFAGAITQAGDGNGGARIRTDWPLRPGMVFTQQAWDSAKAQALRQLGAQRYPAAALAESRADVDADQHAVRLALTLDSGPRYRLGPVRVSGSQRHDPAMAERLARLVPGTDYDTRELADAQQRLLDSGYYDAAWVTLEPDGPPEAAPVRIDLREAPLQKLVLGVGASTDSGARASLVHTHHRLPGLGWRGVSKLSADRALQLLGTELTAPPERDHWRWLTSLQLQREQGTSFDTASTRLRLGRTQGGRSIDRNTYLQFDRARTTARGGSLTPAVTASALGAHFAWTRRDFDDLPFPAGGQGLAVELGGGLTLEQPRAPYARALVRWLGVWTPRRADVPVNARGAGGRLALRAEAGAVAARAAARVPATQLFLAGGDASVRGYALNSIGVTLPTGETAAGRYRAVGSVEWQQPLLRGGVPTDWEATVFLDAGAVADRVSELRGRVGVGFGVRWRSPVGPLQVDLARGQSTGQWRLHLNVGFSF